MLQRPVSYINQKGCGGPTQRLAHRLHCALQVRQLPLNPSRICADITLSYETECSVIPSISSEMAREKKTKKRSAWVWEISHTALWLSWTEKWLWAITEWAEVSVSKNTMCIGQPCHARLRTKMMSENKQLIQKQMWCKKKKTTAPTDFLS